MSNELKGMHAIGYARVSTDDKGQTTETQVKAINEWARANGVIMDRIIQEDISGKVWPRPGLSEAIISVVTTSASMLVCYDQSRLTRDAEHQLPLIRQMLDKKVVRFVVNGDADPEDFAIKMMQAVKGVSDSEERRVIGEKTALKLAYLRDNCNQHVGRPARLIIADSTEGMKQGLVTEKTLVLRPDRVLGFAQQGWTVNYVATRLLNMPAITLIRALKKAGLYEQYNQIINEVQGKCVSRN